MDSTEDLSARVLIKHILNVEPPRTPLTRSVAAKNSAPRRSGRLNTNDPGAHTPQGMLRRSLKHKMRESISRKTLPNKRRTTSTVLKRTPGQASMLFDDGDTPRQIFKNILLTEPVKSPLVNEHVEPREQLLHQPSPDSSLHSRRPSIELSGLELSDLTIGNVETTVKRLNRKRPYRSLNVTAFEKRLKGVRDVAQEESLDDHSSLSLSSSTSLSLKTPFTDVRTERKALQRKGSNRRKVSEEDFGAAVDKREMGNHGTSILAPTHLGETTCSVGFALGLSKISEPDITTDIVHCNTALYAQTDGIMSNYPTLATQDKPTVMASRFQSDLQLDVHQQPYSFPLEENTMAEDQDRNQSSSAYNDIPEALDKNTPCQSELEKMKAIQSFVVGDLAESETVDNIEDHSFGGGNSQTGTEDDAGAVTFSQSGDKANIQTENHSGSEDGEEAKKEDPATEKQSHQVYDEEPMHEEEMQDEEESEEEVENEKEENETAEKGGEKEEGDEEVEQAEPDMGGVEEEAEDSVGDSEGDEVLKADSQEDEDGNLEHISQRAVCTDGELVMPTQNTDADFPVDTIPESFNDMAEPSVYKDDDAEVEADLTENKENTFQESDPPDEVERVEYFEEGGEEEEEEDCNEDFPVTTPAFIKEKRNFLNCDPQASPFTSKNIQPSGAGPKSKQKGQRKPRSLKSDAGLPKSYLMNVFKHFTKTKVSADVYPVLKDVMDKFFDRLAKDLEAYALHARRSTIDVADCELLLRRQGHVNDKVPVEVLIEKYLRMDQRKILIPIATSGNVVFPKRR
ncbi:centromere protein T [Boleophthalmus pectinirostris]|uniref:centromere protein T n=1 Tax=Boleophthalmus pectinirostris TaxID=150288 RepID=UPI00242D0208|nr:centromere protein T [Boleophthalmus pectinirostris]